MGGRRPHGALSTVPAPLSSVIITSYAAARCDAPPGLRPVTVDAEVLPGPLPRARQGRGGRDPAVRAQVMQTQAAAYLVHQALDRIRQRLGVSGQVDVHVRSPDGQVRAPAVAEEIAERLRAAGVTVQVVHRHHGHSGPTR
ncbi:hypothetical protein [Streptomyces sp. NPDC052496]|uniref:RapZ C-terminal domain-containing protein n=1 Tax=Streptomyces sp. NPDC052496 TaxID=3154951 RepID=UPI00342BF082